MSYDLPGHEKEEPVPVMPPYPKIYAPYLTVYLLMRTFCSRCFENNFSRTK
jgi:hypothetical protein